jgi:hypothetical protein
MRSRLKPAAPAAMIKNVSVLAARVCLILKIQVLFHDVHDVKGYASALAKESNRRVLV